MSVCACVGVGGGGVCEVEMKWNSIKELSLLVESNWQQKAVIIVEPDL